MKPPGVGVVRDLGMDPEDRDPRRESRRALIYHPLVPATLGPVRRALRIQPLDALRAE